MGTPKETEGRICMTWVSFLFICLILDLEQEITSFVFSWNELYELSCLQAKASTGQMWIRIVLQETEIKQHKSITAKLRSAHSPVCPAPKWGRKAENPSSNVPKYKSENHLLEHTLTAFYAFIISLLTLSFCSLDQPSAAVLAISVLAIFHIAF